MCNPFGNYTRNCSGLDLSKQLCHVQAVYIKILRHTIYHVQELCLYHHHENFKTYYLPCSRALFISSMHQNPKTYSTIYHVRPWACISTTNCQLPPIVHLISIGSNWVLKLKKKLDWKLNLKIWQLHIWSQLAQIGF